jgi:hypothetical protein
VRIDEMKVLMPRVMKWRALTPFLLLFPDRGLVHGSEQSKLTF